MWSVVFPPAMAPRLDTSTPRFLGAVTGACTCWHGKEPQRTVVACMGVSHLLLCTVSDSSTMHTHSMQRQICIWFASSDSMTRTVDVGQPLKKARLLIVVPSQEAFDAIPQCIICHL